MAIAKKITNFLEKNKLKYKIIEHKTVYTAFDKAQTLKAPLKIIGKTLVVRFDRETAILLISANRNLDKKKLKKVVNKKRKKEDKKLVSKISFVSESWMKKKLRGTKLGAVPPFGPLWKMETFVDRNFLRQPKIILNSGDCNFSFKISSTVFKKKLPGLTIGNFTKARKL